MRKAKPVILSDSDHTTLEQWTRSRMLPAPQVERAHIVVLAARGRQDKAITGELGVSSPQGRAAGASVFWPAASTPWRAKIHGPGASRASTRRPWCNAPPAPGVFEVPRSSGRADAGGSRRASDRGQRCAAPARQGGSVAQEASALFSPLHADRASWLNRVERFFRDLTARRVRAGVFRSVAALELAITDYIHAHQPAAQAVHLDGQGPGHPGQSLPRPVRHE